MSSIELALKLAQQQGIDRFDAQLLMLFALNKSSNERAWLLTHEQQILTNPQHQQFQLLCNQRQQDIPIAYLLGEKEFYGLPFKVTAATLIPRPDTETLVDWALQILAESKIHQPKVLDLGTGSGAIACAIKANHPNTQIWAVDSNDGALTIAKVNAYNLDIEINFLLSNWYQNLPQSLEFNLIVSNPPYIKANDEHLIKLRHEPITALVAADDGLADIRQIISQATNHLADNGHLILEHGYDQANAAKQLFQQYGFTMVQHHQDLAGINRCTGGVRIKDNG